MSEAQSRVSPIVVIAAVAVIVFSVVGVGVMTGVIPSSRSTETAVQAPAAKASQGSAKPSQSAPRPGNPPAAKQPPTRVAVAEPAPAPVSVPVAAAPRVCDECGVIDAINVVEQKGQGSGLGAAGGAVVGGLLGHQVGSGRGNTAATVVGAVGGAVVGNEVERRVKTTKQYNVSVRKDDGNVRNFAFDSAPGFAVGDKVKVIDGKLVKS